LKKNIIRADSARKKSKREIPINEWDENFAFSTGYTSAGVAYGINWNEMNILYLLAYRFTSKSRYLTK